jgi:predicted nucleic acid-binding protein
MILADTSVWIEHFRAGDAQLVHHLQSSMIQMHPFVLGELALGNLHRRTQVLPMLGHLRRTATATDKEVLEFIDLNRLSGLGIGYIDAHLLAAVRLTPGSVLWTRHSRLRRLATQMKIAFSET